MVRGVARQTFRTRLSQIFADRFGTVAGGALRAAAEFG
jgi:hypothetical protein